MSTMPKPEYCDQEWSDMKPTDGGRICGQCSKVIVDFSQMKWVEIERIQNEHNNSLCGMYSQKQLDNWGREVPANNCSKYAATAALLISLATSGHVSGQTTAKPDTITRTIVKGTITGKSLQGSINTLGFVKIHLKGTRFGVVADENGNYQIDLTDYIDTIEDPTLIYLRDGCEPFERNLNKESKGELNYDVQLIQLIYYVEPKKTTPRIIAFGVPKRTLGQRIKRRFKRWFGRKYK